MRTQFTELTNAQWQVIEKLVDTPRKRKTSLRRVVDALRWLAQTGSQWRNLATHFPAWQTVYYYFRQWTAKQIWQQVLAQLVRLERCRQGRQPQPSRVAVDSQSVRKGLWVSHDTGIDGNKRVNGRKRHLAVDSLGLLIGVYVSAANVQDGIAGTELLWQLEPWRQRLELIVADGSYQGGFETNAGYCGFRVSISQRPESATGFVAQKGRWQVERSFAWLNAYRRLSRDYEKTAEAAETFLRIAFIDMILAKC